MKTNNQHVRTFLMLIFISSLLFIGSCAPNYSNESYLTIPEKLTTSVTHDFKGKVIIVGAGAAGLSAANLLENSGVDYQILEATNRFGGRIKMNDSFADFLLI